MSESVDIRGLPKGVLLKALYDHEPGRLTGDDTPAAMARFMAALNDSSATTEWDEKAKGYVDYLHGRCMKVDLRGDTFNPWGYDRDNGGPGTAALIVKLLFDRIHKAVMDKAVQTE